MGRRPGAMAGFAALAVAGVLAVAGCGPDPAAAGVPLTVFAAASLGGPLEEIERAYEASAPGAELLVSTDSSAALATRIEHGAAADVFLSADLEQPQRLADAGLAAGEVVPFARNRLAVVVPAGNPAAVVTPADLARPGVRVIAAGDAVPITGYAADLVDRLAAVPGYPPGFASGYLANVVSREDSVAAVVTKIELGEGDAAIVYATDAAADAALEEVELPEGVDVEATYGAIVLAGSDRVGAARRFLRWLTGPEGRSLLERAGFGPLPG